MKEIWYHAKCYDGFGAAFAAWKKLKNENINIIPIAYGYSCPALNPETKHVYILDFHYDIETLKSLANICSVSLIDHHKTAYEKLLPYVGKVANLEIILDQTKSGAYLAWEYFHREEPPALIQYISDRDLWEFKLDGTKNIHMALLSEPMEMEVWDNFNINDLLKSGGYMNRMYNSLVDKICDNFFYGTIGGFEIPMVNTSIAWSEVGDELLRRHPSSKFVASFTVFKDQTMWSLRSRPDFDVSQIAKKFGGGGHKQAAGFKSVRY